MELRSGKMKAWIYTTDDWNYGGTLDKEPIGWFEEINSIEDLFKILDRWNAAEREIRKYEVKELVISRFDADDLANAKKYGKPIADIKVEIYEW